MFWLRGKDGETPPSFCQDNMKKENHGEEIAKFGFSIIQSSLDDASCDKHKEIVPECKDCEEILSLVKSYQTHSHRFSCYKKKKYMKILPNEGYGRRDGEIEGAELRVPVCRYAFPKPPSNETTFIQAFQNDLPKEVLKAAKEDYMKIKKYLIRLTHAENFRETIQWKTFCSLGFFDFLYELGFLESLTDDESKVEARNRYFNALRCDVKSTGLLILKRNCSEDIFVNNYNKTLLRLHQANIDLQYITDEYAVAEYVCDYCTKVSSIMKFYLSHFKLQL